MLFFSISVGRAMLLFTIPHLPVAAGGLKSNDLFATAVGFCIISAIIAAARDLFACMTSRGTWFLALKMLLLILTWMVIIPLLVGLLVDLLLISPFIGPDDDFPVLDFFCIWSLGSLLKKLWIKLLLAALGAPYVLAKLVFPRFGYSAAMNSTVYHFAWLGSLGFCVLCYLGKVLCVQLHDSITDDRYIIGQRLKDVGDGCSDRDQVIKVGLKLQGEYRPPY
ncbi:probable E3 ubiquitin ligase SUD1 [Triticum dicoccoides]|uniref:probable E3 ubiquitin ligase SUD1 n=1 Tax=Triticum dicoccoides TaxID=85692 RepID=UPI00188F19C7|nr:probable E3 ubiquitin ligase SUD1 [Triticum dicoccoides]